MPCTKFSGAILKQKLGLNFLSAWSWYRDISCSRASEGGGGRGDLKTLGRNADVSRFASIKGYYYCVTTRVAFCRS